VRPTPPRGRVVRLRLCTGVPFFFGPAQTWEARRLPTNRFLPRSRPGGASWFPDGLCGMRARCS
jgi:hypothetical protein